MCHDRLRRICLTGVRAVGKTTLLNYISARLPQVDCIIGSKVLRELAGNDFNHFDFLPEEKKREYRERAVDWLENRQAVVGKHIVCEGHTALYDESSQRVTPVFTEKDCRFFHEIVLLELPLEVICARRLSDLSKNRCTVRSVIYSEIKSERESCEAISMAYNLRLFKLLMSDDRDVRESIIEYLS